MDLILASASPRRKELLSWLGLSFVVTPSGYDEDLITADDPVEMVEELALVKAEQVGKDESGIILACDTEVIIDNQALGKARDKAHAQLILQKLSGRTHQVVTAVAVLDSVTGERQVEHERSEVTMRPFGTEDIDNYLQTDIWLDKAGAYAIQQDPEKFVIGFSGSFTNIIGLPLVRVAHLLGEFGVDCPADVRGIIRARCGQDS